MPERIAVVGVCGGEPVGKEARAAIEAASLVAGAARHLRTLTPIGARTLPIDGPLTDVLDALERERGGVCVLASGDPGFFGIVRVLAERFGAERPRRPPCAVLGGPLAFARLGPAVGRRRRRSRPTVARLADAARSCGPAPEGGGARRAGCAARSAGPGAVRASVRCTAVLAVCTRLGEPDERSMSHDARGARGAVVGPDVGRRAPRGDGVAEARRSSGG